MIIRASSATMKIRPLIIDDQIKARAKEVMDYAQDHPYVPYRDPPPGDDPRYVLETDFGYRCVFSFTKAQEHSFRDLSVSVDTPGKFPNEFAFYTIASDLFGFTGWDGATIIPPPPAWMIAKDPVCDAIRVVQPL
jgi:hypothetical protein